MRILQSRAAIRLSGPDSRSFLQRILTQDVASLGDGRGAFAALLSPQGKIAFDFFCAPVGEDFLLDCDRAHSAPLMQRLSLYKLRAQVEIAAAPDLAIAVGDAPSGAAAAFSDPRCADLPPRAFITGGAAEPAGDDSYDVRRLSLGVPEFGRDFFTDEAFLLDVNYDVLNGVSYAKGCFVGQEVTSRMKRKGEIRKRTLIARFDGPPPPKGAAVAAGAATIGEVLSGREGVALALIRQDRLSAAEAQGEMFTIDGRPTEIVFPAYLERG
jgi:hypothetical protein